MSDDDQTLRLGRSEEIEDVLEAFSHNTLGRDFPDQIKLPRKKTTAYQRELQRTFDRLENEANWRRKKELRQRQEKVEELLAAKK